MLIDFHPPNDWRCCCCWSQNRCLAPILFFCAPFLALIRQPKLQSSLPSVLVASFHVLRSMVAVCVIQGTRRYWLDFYRLHPTIVDTHVCPVSAGIVTMRPLAVCSTFLLSEFYFVRPTHKSRPAPSIYSAEWARQVQQPIPGLGPTSCGQHTSLHSYWQQHLNLSARHLFRPSSVIQGNDSSFTSGHWNGSNARRVHSTPARAVLIYAGKIRITASRFSELISVEVKVTLESVLSLNWFLFQSIHSMVRWSAEP